MATETQHALGKEKTDRRVVKTRRAIREAFRKLVVEHGIDGVTVSALAREADIDRKTFYLHYASTDDLIEQEAADIVAILLDAEERAGREIGIRSPLDTRPLITALAQLVDEDPALYHQLFASMPVDRMEAAMHPSVKSAALEAGWGRLFSNEASLDYLIGYFITGMLSVFRMWLAGGRSDPIDAIVEVLDAAVAINSAQIEPAIEKARS